MAGKNLWEKRKTYALIFVVFVALLTMFVFLNKTNDKDIKIELENKELNERLNEYMQNVLSGGPGVDGIPPIDNPKYVSIEEADSFLDNKDVVFLVDYNGKVLVYPQKILVWHEIINEEINGEKVSITYCPLTGSAIGFKGVLSVEETTFGTSGKLLNSNLVMYDRKTKSYFPQILGMGISGELKGERLKEFPVIFTRWENIKKNYNEAKVLSDNTGYIRNYNRDPYGSYISEENYYDSGSPFFPVMNKDSRFQDKEVVIAGRVNEIPFAILKSSVREKGEIEFEVSGIKLTSIYDDSLDTVRVFDESNELVNTFDVMWFGWVAFEPETEVIQ